mmetsp:Transcript_35525/g.80153  ORF Transcript_35525/g.80153 Transcript_35525/m.80153 type:complete len:281 (+) Transcript_35525:197-1039(+)
MGLGAGCICIGGRCCIKAAGEGGGGGGGLASLFCSFCTAFSTSSFRSSGPEGAPEGMAGGGMGTGASIAPGSLTMRILANMDALGFAAWERGPFAITARCTSGSSDLRAMAALASMPLPAMNLSTSVPPVSIIGTTAPVCPLCEEGSGRSVPFLASLILATITPLGSRQARKGPLSMTASATCTGSLRNWFAAPMSTEFATRKLSTSCEHISLMSRTSSADLIESSASGAPYQRDLGFVGKCLDMSTGSTERVKGLPNGIHKVEESWRLHASFKDLNRIA